MFSDRYLLGVKFCLSHTQIGTFLGVHLKFPDEHPRPFYMGVPPPPPPDGGTVFSTICCKPRRWLFSAEFECRRCNSLCWSMRAETVFVMCSSKLKVSSTRTLWSFSEGTGDNSFWRSVSLLNVTSYSRFVAQWSVSCSSSWKLAGLKPHVHIFWTLQWTGTQGGCLLHVVGHIMISFLR